MYEVEFDLQIPNLHEEAYLSYGKVGRVQISRVTILDGVLKLLMNRSMRDCLHLDVDNKCLESHNIGLENSLFVPNPDLYQPLQEVILRQYQDGQWQGYYFVTPIFVQDLQRELVLGSNDFSRLGAEWNSETKQLVPFIPEQPIFQRVALTSMQGMVPTQDRVRRLL